MNSRLRAAAALVGLALWLAACGRGGAGPETPPPTVAAPGGPLKVLVSQAGMVELTAADLAPHGLAGQPQSLRLSWRGQPQPLWVEGQGDDLRVRFYAWASDSVYTGDSVYWLQSGGSPPLWMAEPAAEAGDPPGEPQSQALASVRREENLQYVPQVEAGDHFFWQLLAAPGAVEIEVDLERVAPGAGRLQVALWASTEAPADPDHRLKLFVNGQELADRAWDGLGRQTLEAGIPAGLLVEGPNQVRLEAPALEGVAANLVQLDWVEVAYPRPLVADRDRLAWEGGPAAWQLGGFSGPLAVFDISDPQAAARVAQGTEELAFLGQAGGRFEAVGPDGYLRPARLVPAQTVPDLGAAGRAGEYLVVGPDDLLAATQPLLDWRAQGGLVVEAVPLAAIYDQFGHGFPEPEAVQAFVAHAYENWDPAPRYLLLVGDATYDPRGYLTPPEANRLPTFLVQTVFGGETASDVPFGQVDGDLWPEVAVGRLPARTPAQVTTAVEKILAYEGDLPAGDWQRRVLAVADGQSTAFAHDAQDFLDRFSGAYQKDLFAPGAGEEGVAGALREELKLGSLLVAYFGHGSVSQWGKDNIFTTGDVPGLGNGDRLPVVVNMTCLTGLFTHPQVDSLAESLLWEMGGGAVAVLAPTSLTLPSDQSFLSRALASALQGEGPAILGDISLQARRQVSPDTPGGRDVMLTFLLFGDPALRLAGGTEN